MSEARFRAENCERAWRDMDAHLEGRLAAPYEEQLSRHLQQCPDCARELSSRRSLRERVRSAAKGVIATPGLERRIRQRLTSKTKRPRIVPAFVAVTAGFVLFAAGGYFYGRSQQDAYIASISSRVALLMRVGLSDHVHCAVFRKYPKDPPSLIAVAADMDPQYRALIPIVRSQTPEDLRLMLAHECSYRGRKFVHLALRSDKHLVSLVITRKQPGESFDSSGLLPVLAQSGISLYDAGTANLHIAAFETRDRLVYFISDMPDRTNLETVAALAPQIRDFFKKLDG